MKKFISIFLALVMIFSLTSVAFAKDGANTPVIVVRGMGEILYEENEDGTRTQVFAPDTKGILGAVTQIAPALAKALVTDDYSKLGGSMTKLKDLFLPISCNDDGTLKNNIVVEERPENVGNYPDVSDNCEWGIAYALADTVGAENTYFFTYVWTRSPISIADDLNAYIEKVKAETGSDKVSLVACSMGGTIFRNTARTALRTSLWRQQLSSERKSSASSSPRISTSAFMMFLIISADFSATTSLRAHFRSSRRLSFRQAFQAASTNSLTS